MNPALRLRYLDAMGISAWRPHTALPGARPSPLVKRAQQPARADNASAGAAQRKKPAARPQSAASILQASAESRQARPAARQAREATRASRQADASPPAAMPEAAEAQAVLVLDCPSSLIIIDSGLQDRAQADLLRNLMFAITAAPPASYRATPVTANSAGPAHQQLDELLRGMVHRSISEHATPGLLLMGEAAISVFSKEAELGVLQLAEFGTGLKAVATHGSAVLLEQAALKRQTWAHVQALIPG